ncbi:flavin reductase family protein [Mycobacterium sp. Y57]|uniref:flavin reductase family protein n=1 Tax=Mycolicibacterium xanthum TaxID=2796469 RepID=UPI001C856720|nr:flavin reductase family protein [Mycolicibacterium xanthum]MBX7435140.1 flavin reductase family protein [Mycolicibacterium xanthum]
MIVNPPAPPLCAASDGTQLRRVFGRFPSGVVAVCAEISGQPVGTLVSSFASVSLQPPLASVCVMDTSRSWSQLREAPRLGVSVLGDGHQDLCRQFSSPRDRFAGVSVSTTADGAVLLPEASAWLDCSIYDEITAGDHTIVLLKIEALYADDTTATPLVFCQSRYHRLSA